MRSPPWTEARRFAFAGAVAGLTACTLVTSPGDFTIVDAGPLAESGAHDGHDASDGAASCSSLVDKTPCGTCVASTCCATLLACDDDPACVALLKCTVGDSLCAKDNAKGKAHETAFLNCTTKHCTICSKAGVGDPCGQDGTECADGLTCTGTWCSKSCVGDSDCAGLSANGTNELGGQNRCVLNAESAAACFPGCASSSDCAMFEGTSCEAAEAASGHDTTNVCGGSPVDAGP